MAKIKAVLDQETWVAIDVPEEFQAIVLSLSSTYSVANGMEMPSTDDSSKLHENRVTSQEPVNSAENNTDNGNAVSTSPSTENNVGHARSTQQTIVHGGVGYHMVNWLVIYIFYLIVQVKLHSLLAHLAVLQRDTFISQHFDS
jgi:vacuolar protein sorting-associated protein 54